MGNEKKDQKETKEYKKPEVKKVDLKINEVVMAACKDGVPKGGKGPIGTMCKAGRRGKKFCFEIGS